MNIRKGILISLLILIVILLVLIYEKDVEYFTGNKNEYIPSLIWRQIYLHQEDVETELETFYNNDKYILHIRYEKIKELSQNIDKIQKPFVIITEFIDFSAPLDNRFKDFEKNDFYRIYNSPYLKRWFAVNFDYSLTKKLNDKLEKIVFIPLGMNFHTMSNMNIWMENKTSYKDQEDSIINIYENSQENSNRLNRCFFCCNNNSSAKLKKAGYINQDRNDIKRKLKDNSLVDVSNDIPRTDMWNKFSNYRFIIAPAGNGMDTHRLWEGLILGCIVIVQSTGLDKFMSEFPVVVVKDFNEITEENLKKWHNKYSYMCNDNEIRKKYNSKYWLNIIRNSL